METIEIIFYIELYLLCAVPICFATGCNLRNPAMIFLASYSLLFVPGPLILSNYYNYHYRVDPYLFVLLPLLFFSLSYMGFSRLLSNQHMRKPSVPAVRHGVFDRTLVLSVAYAIGLMAGLVYLAKSGISFGSDSFESERITAQSGMGVFLYLNSMHVIVLPLLFDGVLKGRFDKGAFAALVAMSLMVFFLRGSRTLCAIPLAVMFIQYASVRKVKAIHAVGLAFAAVLSLVLMRAARSGAFDIDYLGSTLANMLSVSFRNANTIISYFPNHIEYQYGSTYFKNFEILLPGAGQDFTMWLKESMGLTFSGGGITPSLVGDFYLNFGFVGVCIGFVFVALLAVKLNQSVNRGQSILALYLTVVLALSVYGGLSNSVLSFSLNALVYFVVNRLSAGYTFTYEDARNYAPVLRNDAESHQRDREVCLSRGRDKEMAAEGGRLSASNRLQPNPRATSFVS